MTRAAPPKISDSKLTPIAFLVPDEKNPRTHPKTQLAQLRKSIAQFGFTQPILALSDGKIVAGHGRREAALELGLTEVPVIIVDGWTKAQIKAYMIADNQIALNSGWDEELLTLNLMELEEAKTAEDEDLSLEITGISAYSLKRLLNEETVTQQISAIYEVVISCDSEKAQRDMIQKLQDQGIKCKAIVA